MDELAQASRSAVGGFLESEADEPVAARAPAEGDMGSGVLAGGGASTDGSPQVAGAPSAADVSGAGSGARTPRGGTSGGSGTGGVAAMASLAPAQAPPPEADAEFWFIADLFGKGAKEHGPVGELALRKEMQRGTVTMDTYAWYDGLAAYKHVQEVPVLKQMLDEEIEKKGEVPPLQSSGGGSGHADGETAGGARMDGGVAAAPAAMMTEQEMLGFGDAGWYFYDKTGERNGPVLFGTLQMYFEYGELNEESYVWRDNAPGNDTEWRMIRSTEGLLAALTGEVSALDRASKLHAFAVDEALNQVSKSVKGKLGDGSPKLLAGVQSRLGQTGHEFREGGGAAADLRSQEQARSDAGVRNELDARSAHLAAVSEMQRSAARNELDAAVNAFDNVLSSDVNKVMYRPDAGLSAEVRERRRAEIARRQKITDRLVDKIRKEGQAAVDSAVVQSVVSQETGEAIEDFRTAKYEFRHLDAGHKIARAETSQAHETARLSLRSAKDALKVPSESEGGQAVADGYRRAERLVLDLARVLNELSQEVGRTDEGYYRLKDEVENGVAQANLALQTARSSCDEMNGRIDEAASVHDALMTECEEAELKAIQTIEDLEAARRRVLGEIEDAKQAWREQMVVDLREQEELKVALAEREGAIEEARETLESDRADFDSWSAGQREAVADFLAKVERMKEDGARSISKAREALDKEILEVEKFKNESETLITLDKNLLAEERARLMADMEDREFRVNERSRRVDDAREDLASKADALDKAHRAQSAELQAISERVRDESKALDIERQAFLRERERFMTDMNEERVTFRETKEQQDRYVTMQKQSIEAERRALDRDRILFEKEKSLFLSELDSSKQLVDKHSASSSIKYGAGGGGEIDMYTQMPSGSQAQPMQTSETPMQAISRSLRSPTGGDRGY